MSLKYQNSELFQIQFRINSYADHTYQKNVYHVNLWQNVLYHKNFSQLLDFTSAPMQPELQMLRLL